MWSKLWLKIHSHHSSQQQHTRVLWCPRQKWSDIMWHHFGEVMEASAQAHSSCWGKTAQLAAERAHVRQSLPNRGSNWCVHASAHLQFAPRALALFCPREDTASQFFCILLEMEAHIATNQNAYNYVFILPDTCSWVHINHLITQWHQLCGTAAHLGYSQVLSTMAHSHMQAVTWKCNHHMKNKHIWNIHTSILIQHTHFYLHQKYLIPS